MGLNVSNTYFFRFRIKLANFYPQIKIIIKQSITANKKILMCVFATIIGKKTSNTDVVHISINGHKKYFYKLNMLLAVIWLGLGARHGYPSGWERCLDEKLQSQHHMAIKKAPKAKCRINAGEWYSSMYITSTSICRSANFCPPWYRNDMLHRYAGRMNAPPCAPLIKNRQNRHS